MDTDQEKQLTERRGSSRRITAPSPSSPTSEAPLYQPFAACHSATVIRLRCGALWVAWLVRARPDEGYVAILSTRWRPGEAHWTEPEYLVGPLSDRRKQVLNPVFLEDARGWLRLLWTEEYEGGPLKFRIFEKRSVDDGVTWGPVDEFAAPSNAFTRTKPLVLSTGAIVLPLYDEFMRYSFVLVSFDGGKDWLKSSPIVAPFGNIQPAVVELADGRLMAYMRPGGKRGHGRRPGSPHLWRSYSSDQGLNWTTPEPTSHPNPNSNVELIRLKSGSLVLVHNASTDQRTPLCAALSQDDGVNWGRPVVLADGPGEFSYPAAVEADGAIHVVFTANRETIRWVRLNESDLPGPTEVEGGS